MTLPSDSTLALITWLASRDSTQLLALVQGRQIAHSACSSFRSLAEALLEPDSIRDALTSLSREELVALSALDVASPSHLSALENLGLISLTGDRPSLLIPASLVPEQDSFARHPGARSPIPATELSHKERTIAAAQGLNAVVSISEFLDALAHQNYSVNAEGKLAASALKSLEGDLGVGYDIAELFRITQHLELVASHLGVVALTPSGHRWRELPDEERYEAVATSWWSKVPPWLTGIMSEHPEHSWDSTLEESLAFSYPLVSPEPALSVIRADADWLGLAHNNIPTPWARELWGRKHVAALFGSSRPPYAEGVFAHDDYTLLATGPLEPGHRSQLSLIATRELGGLVPRYRLTASSVLSALQDGLSPEEIPGLLSEVCLNTVPPGMLALVDDVARRAHELEIHPHGDSTILRVTREGLSEELISDPGLVVLGLKRVSDSELTCSWSAERVHSTLSAAGYVGLMVDTSGSPRTLEPAVVMDDANVGDGLEAALDQLVADATEAAKRGVPAGLSSIIEVATETKTPLEIVVRMPDDTSLTVVMEPKALSAGRLRGVELRHQVEKTLPVSHITRVRAWSEGSD